MIPEIIFEFPEVPQINFLIDLRGESLYQKWLQLGLGTGDYTAFLEWLKVKGDSGASAYDVAVQLGFVGTQAEWIASLKGEKGEKGDKGDQGEAGIQGAQGDKGDDGKSAYQSYLDTTTDNPPMTEAQWSSKKHSATTDKNSETAFQHVDTTVTKETLAENDKVVLYDSETGKVVLSNALNDIETILASI